MHRILYICVDLYRKPCYYERRKHGTLYKTVFGGTNIVVQRSVPVNKNVREEVFLLDSCKFTPFGLCVKTELLKRGKPQKWLEEAVSKKTGMYVDDSVIYKILTGNSKRPKIVSAICETLDINDVEQGG